MEVAVYDYGLGLDSMSADDLPLSIDQHGSHPEQERQCRDSAQQLCSRLATIVQQLPQAAAAADSSQQIGKLQAEGLASATGLLAAQGHAAVLARARLQPAAVSSSHASQVQALAGARCVQLLPLRFS